MTWTETDQFSDLPTPTIRKSEQSIYCLKTIVSANTWQVSRTPHPILCRRHKYTVPFCDKVCMNRYFLISEWFPTIGKHMKVQKVIFSDKYFTTKSKVLKSNSRLPIKNCVICFNESPLKIMKNVFFILKALSVLKIFKFLS